MVWTTTCELAFIDSIGSHAERFRWRWLSPEQRPRLQMWLLEGYLAAPARRDTEHCDFGEARAHAQQRLVNLKELLTSEADPR